MNPSTTDGRVAVEFTAQDMRDVIRALRQTRASQVFRSLRALVVYQEGRCSRGYLRYVLGCTRQQLPEEIQRLEALQLQMESAARHHWNCRCIPVFEHAALDPWRVRYGFGDWRGGYMAPVV